MGSIKGTAHRLMVSIKVTAHSLMVSIKGTAHRPLSTLILMKDGDSLNNIYYILTIR